MLESKEEVGCLERRERVGEWAGGSGGVKRGVGGGGRGRWQGGVGGSGGVKKGGEGVAVPGEWVGVGRKGSGWLWQRE